MLKQSSEITVQTVLGQTYRLQNDLFYTQVEEPFQDFYCVEGIIVKHLECCSSIKTCHLSVEFRKIVRRLLIN